MITLIAMLVGILGLGAVAGYQLGAWLYRLGRGRGHAEGVADAGRLGFRGLEER